MNQKIAGSSSARIDRVLCGKLDRLVWQADQLQLMSEVLCCNGQCVWLWIRRLQVRVLPGSIGFMWQGFSQASMASWPATTDVRGPVLQWTMRLTMNQKIAGSSSARIDRVLCGKLDRLVWQAGRPQVMSEVLWRNRQCVWLWIRRLQVRVLPGSIGFYVARI